MNKGTIHFSSWLSAGAGILSAIFFLSLLIGVRGGIVFVFLSALPLLVVGLSLGSGAAIISVATGYTAVTGIAGLLPGIDWLLVFGLPVSLLVSRALCYYSAFSGIIWYPPRLLLLWLLGYEIIIFLAITVFLSDHPDGLHGILAVTISNALLQLPVAANVAMPSAETLAEITPGLMMTFWTLLITLNTALAQGVLMRFQKNLRPALAISSVEMPSWSVLVLAVAGLFATFASGELGFIAINLVFAIGIGFFFAGLAVVHTLVRSWQSPVLGLTIFYMLLSLLFGWFALIVASLGLIEQWVHLRQFAIRSPDREDRG
jgi:hypothetical protein